VWEEIAKLKNDYFTVFKTVQVVSPSDHFDLLYNSDNNLNFSVSSRLYQIKRLRFMSPQGGMWQAGIPKDLNHPDFVSVASMSNPAPQMNGPYYYDLWGRGNVQLAMPIQIGTKIEVCYTFWPLGLSLMNAGTVSSSGTSVQGLGTYFTQIVQPDFYMDLPQSQSVRAFYLLDSANNPWTLSITDQGFLQTTPGAAGPTQPLYINDIAGGISYQIQPTTQGILQTIPVTFYPAYAEFQTLTSLGVGLRFVLTCMGGILQTTSTAQSNDGQVQAELVSNAGVPQGGQVYRVANILSDTQLTTFTPIVPILTGANYVLATVPEIPREHIRVIGSVALPKIFGWTGDDSRIEEATQIAEKNIQMMKDALIERQNQAPPQKQRFPYGIGRKNRMFMR
jgi:hypothetical protein